MIDYDARKGALRTVLTLKDTVIQQVLQRWEFYALMCFHFGVRISHQGGYFNPEDYGLTLPIILTHVTGSLMTFFVVFYNSNVFARYNQFYVLTKNLNESCLNVVLQLSIEVKEHKVKRKLVRMMLASCFIFFFERTPSQSTEAAYGMLSKAEWDHLARLGLIDKVQEKQLQAHCRALGNNAVPSYKLLQWSMTLCHHHVDRCVELDKGYWTVRRNQNDVLEMLEMQTPWQYFHIMSLMMVVNLSLWAYSFGLEASHISSMIYLLATCIFMGIRELSITMADPYGDDAADFPLNDWMHQLYVRVIDFCEDSELYYPGAADEILAPDTPVTALPTVKDGQSIIDLLRDLHSQEMKDLGVRKGSPTNSTDKERQTAKSMDRRPASTPARVTPDADGGGSYTQLPMWPGCDDARDTMLDIAFSDAD